MEENVSNNKFLILAIVLVSLVGISAFLIGYGMNDGECPVCSDKKVVKVFTTNNNVEDEVDYNMVTSVIKKELVGKYINKNDDDTYLEIMSDGSFILSLYSEEMEDYVEYSNEEYVLLIYYSMEDVAVSDDGLADDESEVENVTSETDLTSFAEASEEEKTQIEYKTTMYFIPKGKIVGDLISNIVTFTDAETTLDGISDLMIGPEINNTQYYIKK
ncbi:MAG: hypothetical protein PHD02_01815 [Bacilli bacterium]|nr:hypothetical protein [Bacilli bacterium]